MLGKLGHIVIILVLLSELFETTTPFVRSASSPKFTNHLPKAANVQSLAKHIDHDLSLSPSHEEEEDENDLIILGIEWPMLAPHCKYLARTFGLNFLIEFIDLSHLLQASISSRERPPRIFA